MMDSAALIQLVINALALGSAYALVACGFVLVINATGAVNFAQGDLVMAGGFITVLLADALPLPGLILLPAVLAGTAIIGLALGLVAFWPLRHRPPVSVFISTIAVGMILSEGADALFGAAPRGGPPLLAGGRATLGDITIGWQTIAIIVTSWLVLGGLWLILRRTQLGRRLRATAQDPEMAATLGLPVGVLIISTFALAAALAGLAGLLLSNQYFVAADEGTGLILRAYIATALGGWGSLGGAALAALLVAVFEVLVASLVAYPMAETGLFVLVLLVLWLRPQGLFGEAISVRA